MKHTKIPGAFSLASQQAFWPPGESLVIRQWTCQKKKNVSSGGDSKQKRKTPASARCCVTCVCVCVGLSSCLDAVCREHSLATCLQSQKDGRAAAGLSNVDYRSLQKDNRPRGSQHLSRPLHPWLTCLHPSKSICNKSITSSGCGRCCSISFLNLKMVQDQQHL